MGGGGSGVAATNLNRWVHVRGPRPFEPLARAKGRVDRRIDGAGRLSDGITVDGSPLLLGFATQSASSPPRRLVSRRWRSRLNTLFRDGREVAGRSLLGRINSLRIPCSGEKNSLLGMRREFARNPLDSLTLSVPFFVDSAETRKIPCLFPACREFLVGEEASIERRAEPLHRRTEFREAGRDHAHVVDRYWFSAREPQDEEAHRDAVVHVRGHEPAAARRPAFDDEIVALDRVCDARGRKARGDGGEPVAL